MYGTTGEEMEMLAGLAGAMGTISLITCIVSVFFIIVNWKLFAKAGEPGWASIIPIYNSYVLYKIAWGKGWMFLCTLIPIIGFIFPLICNIKLAKAFGKGTGFGIGLIFLPVIFQPMLAFGDAEYVGPQA